MLTPNSDAIERAAQEWLEAMASVSCKLEYDADLSDTALLEDYKRGLDKHAPLPSRDVLLAAIRRNPWCIEYVSETLVEDMQLLAVRTDGRTLRRIENPSENVILAAIRQDPITIALVDNPSEAAQYLALTNRATPGTFDSYILALESRQFCDAVLDRVKPGLSSVRRLYTGDDYVTIQESYITFAAQPWPTLSVDLPNDILYGQD